jgi:hypothetical protein
MFCHKKLYEYRTSKQNISRNCVCDKLLNKNKKYKAHNSYEEIWRERTNSFKAVKFSFISGDVDGSGKADAENAEKYVPIEDGNLFG